MSTAVVKPSNTQSPSAQGAGGKERFPPERFVLIPDVVIFAEHTTRLQSGQEVTYDRAVLEKIAENCNRRIRRTGNYAAVCIGHTGPHKEDRDKPLIGFAGPFRVEEQAGRAVITADLHIFKENLEEFRRYPRPSPEVWIPSDGFDPDRIFLDPIAFLGADAPRLDLGMVFLYMAQAQDHWQCEKYAAVFPGPASVHIPDSQNPYAKGQESMPNLTPEDIQAILKAIEATDWHQWIRQQMAASTKPEDKKGEPPETKPPEINGKKESYEKEPDDKSNALAPEPEPSPEDKDKPKKKEEYKCTTHYGRESEMAIQKELYQLRRALEEERALRINTERRRVLENLSRYYAVNLQEEMEQCQYGRMDDTAFQKHVERIEKYYRPLPVETSLPAWGEGTDASDSPASREYYQKKRDEEISEKARQLAERLANRGQWISYEEALQRVLQGKE